MKETITNLNSIYLALDTLNVSGHQQTKMFSNCMDMLVYTIKSLQEQEQKTDTKNKEITTEEISG